MFPVQTLLQEEKIFLRKHILRAVNVQSDIFLETKGIIIILFRTAIWYLKCDTTDQVSKPQPRKQWQATKIWEWSCGQSNVTLMRPRNGRFLKLRSVN